GIGLVFGFVGSYVSYHSYSGGVVVLVVSILAGVIALSGLSMTISVRIQLGTFWSNNLSVSLFKGIRAGSGKFFRSIRKLLDSRTILSRVFLAIFMIILIKAALLTLSIVFSIPWLFVVGTLGIDLIIAIFVLVISLHLREIEKAGEALSSGQLDYQIQTDAMPQMLRHHCDDMNNIGLITQTIIFIFRVKRALRTIHYSPLTIHISCNLYFTNYNEIFALLGVVDSSLESTKLRNNNLINWKSSS
ncbi:hypothetical protein J6P92_08930, partial [bacterium]|nr:hypothetical protein [bacterium]